MGGEIPHLAQEHRQAAPGSIAGDAAPVDAAADDGEETCGGEPCAASRWLHEEADQLTVNVIGLRVKNYAWMGDQGILDAKCLAEENGGQYLPVDSLAGLREALERTLGCPMVTRVFPKEP